MENSPVIDPKNELPAPKQELDLPAPHDMLLPAHFTHRHSWIHWTPALVGLLVGLFVGLFVFRDAETPRKKIIENTKITPTMRVQQITNSQSANVSIVPYSDTLNKVTNHTYRFDFIIPNEYTLQGEDKLFSVGYQGQKNSEPLSRDFAVLEFKVNKLQSRKIQDIARKEYNDVKLNEGESTVLSDIETKIINGITGYSFSCPSLVTQECIYLPLNSTEYLTIVKKYSDEDNNGYNKQLDQILNSFNMLVITPTTMQNKPGETVFCTQEVKVCPDGSSVGRTGPKCEFLPCSTLQP